MQDLPTSNAPLSTEQSSRCIKKHRAQRAAHNQAIGRSRGSLTTKTVALMDALGNLVRFMLLLGHSSNLKGVQPLTDELDFDAPLA